MYFSFFFFNIFFIIFFHDEKLSIKHEYSKAFEIGIVQNTAVKLIVLIWFASISNFQAFDRKLYQRPFIVNKC